MSLLHWWFCAGVKPYCDGLKPLFQQVTLHLYRQKNKKETKFTELIHTCKMWWFCLCHHTSCLHLYIRHRHKEVKKRTPSNRKCVYLQVDTDLTNNMWRSLHWLWGNKSTYHPIIHCVRSRKTGEYLNQDQWAPARAQEGRLVWVVYTTRPAQTAKEVNAGSRVDRNVNSKPLFAASQGWPPAAII